MTYYINIHENNETEFATFETINGEALYDAIAVAMDAMGFTPYEGDQPFNFEYCCCSFWIDKKTKEVFLLVYEWTSENKMELTKLGE